ncbi:hypothetical protein F4803DRAFT_517243, partial [Xylaria telfairii]
MGSADDEGGTGSTASRGREAGDSGSRSGRTGAEIGVNMTDLTDEAGGDWIGAESLVGDPRRASSLSRCLRMRDGSCRPMVGISKSSGKMVISFALVVLPVKGFSHCVLLLVVAGGSVWVLLSTIVLFGFVGGSILPMTTMGEIVRIGNGCEGRGAGGEAGSLVFL